MRPGTDEQALTAVRGVAFDAMGVLYTWGDDLRNGLIPFALAHGSPLTATEIAAIYRRALVGELTTAELWSQAGVAGQPAELDRRYLAGYEITPGMPELLDELRDRGLVLGCISNDVAEWSRARRTRFGLDYRIPHWTVSGEARSRKPDERLYRVFLESTGLAAEEFVFVDDRLVNVRAAAKLGFTTVLVNFGGSQDEPGSVRTVDELRAALTQPLPRP